MASDIAFVEFVVDQIDNAGEITFKKMFGEFGLYTDGKIFALICRDQLFIKPTNAGKAFIGDPVEAPPYPGAKMYYLIEDEIEDRDWISTLVRVSAEELPLPKPKKKKG
jgi:TfoX/Sxy family transcriptional regulator of competence genes